jgi:hypothetical protein
LTTTAPGGSSPARNSPTASCRREMKELQVKLDRLEQEQLAETGRAVA